MRNTSTNGFDLTGRRDTSNGNDRAPTSASSDRPTEMHSGSGRNRVDSSAISKLTSTIVRVRDLRGRLGDVAAMRRRLEVERDRTSFQLAIRERDVKTATDVGRDFCAARARHAVECLKDESLETDALMTELDLVTISLERERRMLASQLGECQRVADALPTERDRTRARRIIEDAMSRLGLPARVRL